MRTSESDPIRVDMVQPGLGCTFAPGKHAKSMVGDDWARDLGADLHQLRAVYEVDLLVSLVEEWELDFLGISDLVEQATVRGIEVLRSPIRDGGTPELAEARRVVQAALAAREQGHTVVFHCRGGLGRAGTLAGCTLRALGMGPDEAIAATRAGRPGAIENPAQEQFVRDFTL